MIGNIKQRLLRKLQGKRYRDAYVGSQVSTGLAYQTREIREQRGLTQEALGARINKRQNLISRLEDPDYGRYTVKTLLELASAFDVALLVKFVPYSHFLREMEDKHPGALQVPSFEDELPRLKADAQKGSVWKDSFQFEIGAASNVVLAANDDGSKQHIFVVDGNKFAA